MAECCQISTLLLKSTSVAEAADLRPLPLFHMQRSAISTILLLLIFLGIAWLVFAVATGANKPTEAVALPLLQHPMDARGLVFSTYTGNQLVSRLRARQILVRPRRFSIFSIKSINELVVVDPLFESFPIPVTRHRFPQAQKGLSDQLSGCLSGLSDMNGLGRIASGLLMNLQMVFHDPSISISRVTARQGSLNFQKNEVMLQDVLLESASRKKKLHCARAIWSNQEQAFLIPEQYSIESSSGRHFGSGVVIDMDFTVKPLQVQHPR